MVCIHCKLSPVWRLVSWKGKVHLCCFHFSLIDIMCVWQSTAGSLQVECYSSFMLILVCLGLGGQGSQIACVTRCVVLVCHASYANAWHNGKLKLCETTWARQHVQCRMLATAVPHVVFYSTHSVHTGYVLFRTTLILLFTCHWMMATINALNFLARYF